MTFILLLFVTRMGWNSSTQNCMLELPVEPPVTLRQLLESPFHLAMAPDFFGLYGYLGALAAWQQALPSSMDNLQSVAGSGVGAIAAIILGAGIDPQVAANFFDNITVSQIADFPGVLTVFRGNRFETLMHRFLLESLSNTSTTAITTRLEDAILPVAVTAFDI
jgi:hypothetical protein